MRDLSTDLMIIHLNITTKPLLKRRTVMNKKSVGDGHVFEIRNSYNYQNNQICYRWFYKYIIEHNFTATIKSFMHMIMNRMVINRNVKFVSKLSTVSDTNNIQKYLNQLNRFTTKGQHILAIHTYKNGSLSNRLLEIINNNTTNIKSHSVIQLGQLLMSSIELLSSQFIANGTQIIYNKLSLKCNVNEILLNSLIDLLRSISDHIKNGNKQIALNNKEYQFIFQIASILRENMNHNEINKFCILLCKLYDEYTNDNGSINSDDETGDDEFVVDKNNVKCIINTLISESTKHINRGLIH